jgi:hypothetical protein
MARFEFVDDGNGSRNVVQVPVIDWHKEMRTCVGDAAELADRISTSDTDVGGAIGRLCNVVTHLLDENKALTERVAVMEYMFTSQGPINKDITIILARYGLRLAALEGKEND